MVFEENKRKRLIGKCAGGVKVNASSCGFWADYTGSAEAAPKPIEKTEAKPAATGGEDSGKSEGDAKGKPVGNWFKRQLAGF